MNTIFSFLLCSGLFLLNVTFANKEPPRLPTSWKAVTIDPPQPEGTELYHFVDDPSSKNVSGHWFLYPDCQKLEYYSRNDQVNMNDYYLGCYSVDCCFLDRGSGIKEWQIDSNKAEYVGEKDVISFGRVIHAHGWSVLYRAFPEKINYTYWVTEGPTLHLIDAQVTGPVILSTQIQFRDFEAIEDPGFEDKFEIPDVCKGNQVHKCPEDVMDTSDPLRISKIARLLQATVFQ